MNNSKNYFCLLMFSLLFLAPAIQAQTSDLLKYLDKTCQGEENKGVIYLDDPEDLIPYLAIFNNGKIWVKNRKTGSLEKFRPAISMHGSYIYVIDSAGRFYISYHNEIDKFHHSSLVAGDPVLCAGELRIDYISGKITYLNNASGHYKPGPENLNLAVKLLRDYGMETRGMILGITNGSDYREIILKN